MKRCFGLLIAASLIVTAGSWVISAESQRTPEKYARIIERFREVYEPLVAERGGRFVIEERWKDKLLSAFADRRGPDGVEWVLGIEAAGTYDHPHVDEESFRFMLCHEMGHLFGGAPRRPLPEGWDGPADTDGLSLLSSEGEADYYAGLKCMRMILADEDNLAAVSKMKVPTYVADRCDAQFPEKKSAALCRRSALAGKAFLDMFLHGFAPEHRPKYAFETPSSFVERVRTNNYSYPVRQCRLDTIVAGSLCKADMTIQPDRFDATIGACSLSAGDNVGVRPVCWFREGSTHGPAAPAL